MPEDCYFWIDGDGEKGVGVICVPCHEAHPQGWFWKGSLKGYGQYDYVCNFCGRAVHKGSFEENPATAGQDAG